MKNVIVMTRGKIGRDGIDIDTEIVDVLGQDLKLGTQIAGRNKTEVEALAVAHIHRKNEI